MAWIEMIGLTVVLIGVGLYALLGVAIVLTALVERRPLKFLAHAEPDDPEWRRLNNVTEPAAGSSQFTGSNPYAAPGTTPYAEKQIREASLLAFSTPVLCRHAKGGIYKTYHALMVTKQATEANAPDKLQTYITGFVVVRSYREGGQIRMAPG